MKFFLAGLAALTILGAGTAGLANVISTFTTDDEGWIVEDLCCHGPYTNPFWRNPLHSVDHKSSGGNFGGYIEKEDPSGNAFYFSAPEKFLGNQSAAYGTYLLYDLFSTEHDWTADPDIVLVGSGLTLVYQGSMIPTPAWQTFAVPMTEKDWHKDTLGGLAPSSSEFASVLASLEALRIRGEYGKYSDELRRETTGLDNVVMVPECSGIIIWFMLGALGIGCGWLRRRAARAKM